MTQQTKRGKDLSVDRRGQDQQLRHGASKVRAR
jgi:hypothetical protein